MKPLIFLSLLSISFIGYGQTFDSWQSNSNSDVEDEAEFFYIPHNLDIAEINKITSIEGKITYSEDELIVDVFNRFWDIANQNGANSYQIDSISVITPDLIEVDISFYKLDQDALYKVFSEYRSNMIYIIGDLNPEALKFKPKKIKLNNIKTPLPPFDYISYQNKVNEEAIIAIGGLTGSKGWIKGKEDRLPYFVTINGFELGPGSTGDISVSFSTGRFYPIDMNFGQFVIEILDARKNTRANKP